MTRDPRWQRLEELFHAALDLDGGDRAAFIERQCSDSPELRDELERLLSAAQDETQLDHVVAQAMVASSEGNDPYDAGDTLGAYRLLRVIGRGGLSTVYLAERADDQYQAQAALKVVRRGMESPDLVARLRQERQILASLDHPNIARLLDGGTTRDGLPFFVMEYIEGQDLETWCNSQRLSIEQRLAVFRQVCDAVDYAHRKLVVHRDIKPGNILVTESGVPKLLDFGIAKLLDSESGAQIAAPTVPGHQLLTPPFASPEQVRGESLTTATDVYSLGVVLYRLLAGRHPYSLASLRPSELEQMICETAVPKASNVVSQEPSVDQDPETETADQIANQRGTSPQKLRRLLEGDLDTIVAKALRKEPERRYTSPDQLADDLQRYADGLPVRARPDTVRYRTGKFLRRHRVAVGAILAVVTLVASLVLFYTLQLASERDKARSAASEAEQAFDVLIDIFEVSDPSRSKGETITARELLDRGATRLRQELANRPAVLATMLEVMGEVYRKLGLSSRARNLLEESLTIRRQHFGEASAEAATSLNLLAEVLYEQRELDDAEEYFRNALDLRLDLLGAGHSDTLVSQNNLAALLFARGDSEGAEALFRQVLDSRRQSSEATEGEIATSLNNLALVLDTRGDFDDAEVLYREALAIKRRIYGSLHLDVANSLNNLAGMLHAAGNAPAARDLYEEALSINRQLVGDGYEDVSRGLEQLAYIAREAGETERAEQYFRESLASWRLNEEPNNAAISSLLGSLGVLLLRSGRHADAEEALAESLDRARQAFPEDDWRIARAASRLGICLLAAGRESEGRVLLTPGLERLAAALGDDDAQVKAARELAKEVGVEA